jgi:hypothetical protein
MRTVEEIRKLKDALRNAGQVMHKNAQDSEDADDKSLWNAEAKACFKAEEACNYALGERSIFDEMMENA